MRNVHAKNRTTAGFNSPTSSALDTYLRYYVNEKPLVQSYNVSSGTSEVRRTVVSKGAVTKQGPLSSSGLNFTRDRFT